MRRFKTLMNEDLTNHRRSSATKIHDLENLERGRIKAPTAHHRSMWIKHYGKRQDDVRNLHGAAIKAHDAHGPESKQFKNASNKANSASRELQTEGKVDTVFKNNVKPQGAANVLGMDISPEDVSKAEFRRATPGHAGNTQAANAFKRAPKGNETINQTRKKPGSGNTIRVPKLELKNRDVTGGRIGKFLNPNVHKPAATQVHDTFGKGKEQIVNPRKGPVRPAQAGVPGVKGSEVKSRAPFKPETPTAVVKPQTPKSPTSKYSAEERAEIVSNAKRVIIRAKQRLKPRTNESVVNENFDLLRNKKIHPELKKVLGPHAKHYHSSGPSDKGILIAFHKKVDHHDIEKRMGNDWGVEHIESKNDKHLYHLRDYSMNESVELDEALNVTQRRKRALIMKRNKAKIAIGRRRAASRVATMDVIKRRAKKAARKDIAKKLSKGVNKGELSTARKMEIEKRMASPAITSRINRLSKRLVRSEREMEMARKQNRNKK